MAEVDWITIRGARQHNLRGFDCRIPTGKFTVITGVSGSGKSSLAFHTLYAEGRRRFVESLSARARQFLDQLPEAEVKAIEGLRPAIAIEQQGSRGNPRSIVATVTEIHDFLRVLWAAAGVAHDPDTGEPLVSWSPATILDHLLEQHEDERALILSPLPPASRSNPEAAVRELAAAGFVRLRLDGDLVELEEADAAGRLGSASEAEIVIDRLVLRDRSRERLGDSIETALERAPEGLRVARQADPDSPWQIEDFPTVPTNPRTGFRSEALTPQHFSFNSRLGTCPTCQGIGAVLEPDPTLLVPDPSLTIAAGALKTWWWSKKRLRPTRLKKLAPLLQDLGGDLETPWRDLPPLACAVILHGPGWQAEVDPSPDEAPARELGKLIAHYRWEGVLPEAARIHRESESQLTRNLARRSLAEQPCPTCAGERLNRASRAVRLPSSGTDQPSPTLPGFLSFTVTEAEEFLAAWKPQAASAPFAAPLLRELLARLGFLQRVGLGYLGLDRPSTTLSGGETQRVRLATQIGGPLTGVLYVLDEPTIGLHPADNKRLLASIHELVERGNTVVAVEHDPEFWRAADWLIEIGPGPGEAGGRLLFEGTPAELMNASIESPTRSALLARGAGVPGDPSASSRSGSGTGAGKNPGELDLTPDHLDPDRLDPDRLDHPDSDPLRDQPRLGIVRPREHNLKIERVDIPLNRLVAVTGPSGSGKSTLVGDVLHPALARTFHRASARPGTHERIEGLDQLERVVLVDQSSLSGSTRSNALTYSKAFDPIRQLFAQLPDSRQRGYGPSRFSFNRPGGRCETCQGTGVQTVDMQLLPPVEVPCPACDGARYNRPTLEIRFKGRNLAEVLALTVHQARELFARIPEIDRRLAPLEAVGLGYLRLGQSSDSFSGGEAQRLRLAAELALPKQARTLYLLDEPTTGLHPQDIAVLLDSLRALIAHGHSMLVIEHHLDVIRAADWVIDLGPGGGDEGGRVVYAGPPSGLARCEDSATGRFLTFERK